MNNPHFDWSDGQLLVGDTKLQLLTHNTLTACSACMMIYIKLTLKQYTHAQTHVHATHSSIRTHVKTHTNRNILARLGVINSRTNSPASTRIVCNCNELAEGRRDLNRRSINSVQRPFQNVVLLVLAQYA